MTTQIDVVIKQASNATKFPNVILGDIVELTHTGGIKDYYVVSDHIDTSNGEPCLVCITDGLYWSQLCLWGTTLTPDQVRVVKKARITIQF